MGTDVPHDDDYLNEDATSNEERMGGETAAEVLTRVELDLAYFSEKVLNLEILLMQVADRANDHEPRIMDNGDIPTESLANSFEFDILSGILNSEIKELDNFMASLQIEIASNRQKLSKNDHFDEYSTEIEKLCDAEESLTRSQNLVADLAMQSAKFERALSLNDEIGNGQLSSMSAMGKPTLEQQRHVLQMLEKSLARELDLEKKLSDSRYNEEELKMKLHYAEREAHCTEESIEILLERVFEAENAADVLMCISKELTGKLQTVQFKLNCSIERESEMKSMLQENMIKLSAEEGALEKLKSSSADLDSFLVLQANNLKASLKEADDRCVIASSEALTLREKVTELEEQLRESEFQSQLVKDSVEASQRQQELSYSELSELKNVIQGLKEDVLKKESRAESAEAKCTMLTKTNMELNEELGFLKNTGTEKAIFLERKLKESDTQLEHANASVEAIEEQQSMLYSALTDMENLIEDLKTKVSKAESRAESAESKCSLLTETNLELNEELGFLRGRLECMETSLQQADNAKIATSKDIGIRTRIITDLVHKLAFERERLQLQIAALAKMNNILAENCLKTKDSCPSTMNIMGTNAGNEFSILKSSEEALTKFSTTNFQVEKSAAGFSELATSVSTPGEVSELETVRSIEATQLSPKYLFMAFLALLVSVVAVYWFQPESL